MIKFSKQNTKTKNLRNVPALAPYLEGGKKIYSLDLLSGVACPGAKDCKAMAIMGDNGRLTIKDGPATLFRCFSASQEVLFPAVYRLRKNNLKELQSYGNDTNKMVLALTLAIPSDAGIVRVHVAGDMFSLAYLRAWIKMATNHPKVLFYFYTKSLHFLRVIHNEGGCKDLSKGIILDNLLVTASYGGVWDRLIPELNVRTAKVVYSEGEALSNGLVIDHTDEHSALAGNSFGLLIHGTQPAKSKASIALSTIKKDLKNANV